MVIKRTGQKVEFDKLKIREAILCADDDVGLSDKIIENDLQEICNLIADAHEMKGDLTVEEIQDLVEDDLMAFKYYRLASEYVKFRYKKQVAREAQTDFIDAIREKLDASDVQNQNANVDEHSFGGRAGEASGVVTKKLALDYIVSKKTRENHLNNEVYIHDLDNYYVGSHNCLSIPFDELLANGFKTRQTDVRPAGSVNTAFQLVAVIFQLQSLQQFGGVSATHLDWTMVPYVRKSFFKHWKDGMKYCENIDNPTLITPEETSINAKFYTSAYDDAYQYALKMTEKEIHQAVEGMYHNLNTLQSRSGNQLKWMAG